MLLCAALFADMDATLLPVTCSSRVAIGISEVTYCFTRPASYRRTRAAISITGATRFSAFLTPGAALQQVDIEIRAISEASNTFSLFVSTGILAARNMVLVV